MNTMDSLAGMQRMRVQCDSWELRQVGLPNTPWVAASEMLFSVGNGCIGIPGHGEETNVELLPPDLRQPNRRGLSGGGTKLASGAENSGIVPELSLYNCPHVLPSRDMLISAQVSGTDLTAQRPLVGPCFSGFYEQEVPMHGKQVASGVYARENVLARCPDPFCVDVYIGGQQVCATTGRIVSATRKLDVRSGILHRRVVWEADHREVTIESSRFASNVNKNLAYLCFSVSAKNVESTDIRIVSRTLVPNTVDFSVENTVSRYTIQDATNVVAVRTINSCRHLAVATVDSCSSIPLDQNHDADDFDGTSVASFGRSSSQSLADDSYAAPMTSSNTPYPLSSPTQPKNRNAATVLSPKAFETDHGTETVFVSGISENTRIELVKCIGFYGDEDAQQDDLCEMAAQRVAAAAAVGVEAALHEHRMSMLRFWEVADVHVTLSESNLIQGAFRYNTLQLYMSAPRCSWYGYPTRGLTGQMGGQHQWDVDALIVPVFCHIAPEIARNLIEFRIQHLDEARQIASDLQLPRGAVFPLRTVNGTECPPHFTSAFLFVNAVAGMSLRTYVETTNDWSILDAGGAEMLLSTALAFLDWGSWEKGEFCIRCVTGPDMYTGIGDNNFFTNIMAKQHLMWTYEIAASAREHNPERWKEIAERCRVTDADLVHMRSAAENMKILFDAKLRIHVVDESFLRKRKWTFSNLHQDLPQAKHIQNLFHPFVTFRHQVCRIPDVLLAMVLCPSAFTNDELRSNFAFYDPITSRDSAIRLSLLSTMSSLTQQHEQAEEYLKRAVLIDVDDEVMDTANGSHPTTVAGSWWALAVGFGGMRVRDGVLCFSPALPPDVDELKFHARHRGCLVRVHALRRLVTYLLVSVPPGVEEMGIVHGTSWIRLRRNVPEVIRLAREIKAFEFDCVIFDLDSVIDNVEQYHFQAWSATLDEYLQKAGLKDFEMTRELYLAYLRHSQPFAGLNEIMKKYHLPKLHAGDIEDTEEANTLHALCNRKLRYFRAAVKEKGLRIRSGALELMSQLRRCDIAIGCVSGSKNGSWILDETPKLQAMVDTFLDANDGDELGLRYRPETEYFEACAKELDVLPARAILVLDGTDGFSRANLEKFCLIVDVSATPEAITLSVPKCNISCFEEATLELLDQCTCGGGYRSSGDNLPPRQRLESPTFPTSASHTADLGTSTAGTPTS